MRTMKQVAIGSLVVTAMATAARADDPPPTVPTPAAAAEATDTGQTEVIHVTATSPERALFTGRAPVDVISHQDLVDSGHATLGSVLQALPSQANAVNAQANDGDGTTRINLRGLGAARTVVLINGRRMVNGGQGADASVDLDAIPLALIDHIEVIKDGASVVYGADAIGGVVNVITRPEFNGVDVSLLSSSSEHGDGIEYDANLVAGLTTDDKTTYLMVAGGYQHHDPVLAGARHFSAEQRVYDFADHKESRPLSTITPAGRLDTTTIGAGGLQPPGCTSSLCKLSPGGGFANFGPGDLYNEEAQDYIYTPSTRYNLYAGGGNRVNAHTSLFVEALLEHRDSTRSLSPASFDANAVISKDSIYNPLGADVGDFRRRLNDLGPRQSIDQVTTVRVVGGITGTLPIEAIKDWSYEVSYNYAYTQETLGTTGQLFTLRTGDALGPSMIFEGTPICVKTPGDPNTKIVYQTVPPFPGGPRFVIPCVPLNLFAGKIPADQLKGVTFSDQGQGSDVQGTFLATTQGRIAKLPNHGEITLAAGADGRAESGLQTPLSAASSGDTTDAPTRIPPTETSGDFHIYEGFAEATVVAFARPAGDPLQRLEFNAGARAIDHTRFGKELTYKLGGLFRTVQGLSARATYSTAFRAPSVLDLFQGRTLRTPFLEDSCDARPPSAGGGVKTLDAVAQAACSAQGVPAGTAFGTNQQTAVSGGNPKLTPETAATATFGVVYEPPQLPGLAASVDYWHVKIDHAIETLSVQTIFANCYERGISAFCDQVVRDPNTHQLLEIDASPQNVTSTATSGVDLGVQYDAQLPSLGRLRATLEGQYLINYDLRTATQTIHGAGLYDLGAFPHVRANLASTWSNAGASAGFNLRYVGGYTECGGDNCNDPHTLATASHAVSQYAKLDLFGGYQLPSWVGRTHLEVGINNVFNITPPIVYNAPTANSDATTYDFLGRMVFARLDQAF